MPGPSENGVHVLVRVRPCQAPESDNEKSSRLMVDEQTGTVALGRGNKGISEFTFSSVLGPTASQGELYHRCQSIIGDDLLNGINCCIMAYGQTGSGKTYSMYGRGFGDAELTVNHSLAENSVELGTGPFMVPGKYADIGIDLDSDNYGVAPRAIADLFQLLELRHGPASTIFADSTTGGTELEGKFSYSVQCQLMQIYNEKIYDLLQDKRRENPLQLRETRRGSANSVHVKGLSSYPVDNTDDVLMLLRRGLKNRAIRSTEFNQESSRGHTILQLNIEVEEEDADGLRVLRRSTLNLVDLAGSEKWKPPTQLSSSTSNNLFANQQAADAQQKEMNNINTSLHVLGNCVSALIEPNRKHIPYRNSVLTRLLQDCLGNAAGRTVFVVTIHEDVSFREESNSTLQFANRASSIKMTVTTSSEVVGTMNLEEAKKQIATLRSRLKQYSDGTSSADMRRPLTTPAALDTTVLRVSPIVTDEPCRPCVICAGFAKQVEELNCAVKALQKENERLCALLANYPVGALTISGPAPPRESPVVNARKDSSCLAPSLPTLSPTQEDAILDSYLLRGIAEPSKNASAVMSADNDRGTGASFSKRSVNSAGRSTKCDELEVVSIQNSPLVVASTAAAESRNQNLAFVSEGTDVVVGDDAQSSDAGTESQSCHSPSVSSLKSLKKKIMKDRSEQIEVVVLPKLQDTTPRLDYQAYAATAALSSCVPLDSYTAENARNLNVPTALSRNWSDGRSLGINALNDDGALNPVQPARVAASLKTAPANLTASADTVEQFAVSSACAKHGLAQCILCAMFGYEAVAAPNSHAPIAVSGLAHPLQNTSLPITTVGTAALIAKSTSQTMPVRAVAGPVQMSPLVNARSRLSADNSSKMDIGPVDTDFAGEFPSPSSSISSFSSWTAAPSIGAGARYKPTASVVSSSNYKSPSTFTNTKKLLSSLDNTECAAHGLVKCLLCAMASTYAPPTSNPLLSEGFEGHSITAGEVFGSAVSRKKNGKAFLQPVDTAGPLESISESIVGFPVMDRTLPTMPSTVTSFDEKSSDLVRGDVVPTGKSSVCVSQTHSESVGAGGHEDTKTPLYDYDNLRRQSSENHGRHTDNKSNYRPIADFDPAEHIALLFGKSKSPRSFNDEYRGVETGDIMDMPSTGRARNTFRVNRYPADYPIQIENDESYHFHAYDGQQSTEVKRDRGDEDNDEHEDENGEAAAALHDYETPGEFSSDVKIIRKTKKKKVKQQQQQQQAGYAQSVRNHRQHDGLAKVSGRAGGQTVNVHQSSTAQRLSAADGYAAAEKAYSSAGSTAKSSKRGPR
jgi:hypothetical protein